MRISDWSSDVCSSDLPVQQRAERHGLDVVVAGEAEGHRTQVDLRIDAEKVEKRGQERGQSDLAIGDAGVFGHEEGRRAHDRRHEDRKSVVWGKSVSVRVDLGGRRMNKKNRKIN